ncbi:MAG: class I SAM-dependent methyltransferase [Polyangiaceae bacterium]|nr:class I SAM-dependent methyltransferase [Polyangiaceae bacterium]
MSAPPATTIPLFAEFPRARILVDDEDVLVVDKPYGLSTHAPDEGRHDDVVSWLTAHLERAGRATYLGIHQRLDRDTSGVLLFARRREANASLAKQFEGHKVRKVYVAVVEGRVPAKVVLHHLISEAKDGARAARAFDGRPRRGEQEAITELAVLERRGRRALVELVPKTGRTHQLRVQLAAAGAPIVGDPLYGGAPEVRLMLHARALELRHPSTGQPLTANAPVPSQLTRALSGQPPRRAGSREELAAAIVDAAERRFGVVATGDTNALRIVNGAGDGLPGITIDLYGRHAVLSFYEDAPEAEAQAVAQALVDAGAAGVYAKFRPKHASRIVDSRRDDIAPSEPIAGDPAAPTFEVVEGGVPFEVHRRRALHGHLPRPARQPQARPRRREGPRVAEPVRVHGRFLRGRRGGGAARTTTVDTSRGALEWARRNLDRVGAKQDAHECVEADVFAFLAAAKARGRTWDLALLDPPSFSTTKKSRFSAEDDYEHLAAATLSVVRPEASCSRARTTEGSRSGSSASGFTARRGRPAGRSRR